MKIYRELEWDKIDSRYIARDDFSYADVKGRVKRLGCDIVVFYKGGNSFPSAVAINEYCEYDSFSSEANELLSRMNFVVRIGDALSRAFDVFGSDYKIDDLMEEKYHFNIAEDYWVTVSVRDNTIVGIEIVFDEEIVSNIFECRWQ